MKCHYDARKNVKVKMIAPIGKAYLGLNDVTKEEDIDHSTQINIDFFILHRNSYKGGGAYDGYGGYDITLVHLKNPAYFHITACLPGPTFQDSGIKAILAGYGKYVRNNCQTDEYGPSKYHYCAETSICNSEEPHPQNSLCKNFFEDPVSNKLGDVTDIVLIGSDNNETYCYQEKSPKVGSSGWCHVDQDASKIQVLSPTDSWGFCGKDCSESDEPLFGVLRIVEDVDILNENLCNTYLEKSVKSYVTVMPKILCVGRKEMIKTVAFEVDGTSYKKTDLSKINNRLKFSPGKQV